MQGIIISNIHSIELYNSEVTYDIIMKLVLWALKAVYVFKKKTFSRIVKNTTGFQIHIVLKFLGNMANHWLPQNCKVSATSVIGRWTGKQSTSHISYVRN